MCTDWEKISLKVEKDLGILVDEKVYVIHQCALSAQKTNCSLAAPKEEWKEITVPLYPNKTPSQNGFKTRLMEPGVAWICGQCMAEGLELDDLPT